MKLAGRQGLKKRFLYIYLPLVATFYLMLNIAGLAIAKPVNRLADVEIKPEQVPIIYNDNYNITFFGVEELHPFDSRKYGRVFSMLRERGLISDESVIWAGLPDEEDLKLVHSASYLKGIRSSWTLARITELRFLRFFPRHVSVNAVLVPMLYQAGGSILAGPLALERRWAINLGGGFHHASRNHGEGFCVVADITLSIEHLRKKHPEVRKVMIVDLDAHQGNGHGRDFTGDEDVFILDAYNAAIYPGDVTAKKGIDLAVELEPFTMDAEYLLKVRKALAEALTAFKPDIIYYVAGTDILEGDKLGAMSISAKGIIKRDALVFGEALSRNIPIIMMLSGGYQKNNAEVIADSIQNLDREFGILKQAKDDG